MSLRRWNDAVASYVLGRLEEMGELGEDTGVASLSSSPISTATEVGVEVRLTATPEGLALVHSSPRPCKARG